MTEADSVARKLRTWQMLLLDLTRANRLLYFKVDRASSVPITSPTAAELFELLVTHDKQLKFPAADESALFEEAADELPAHPERSEAESKDARTPSEPEPREVESMRKSQDERSGAESQAAISEVTHPAAIEPPQMQDAPPAGSPADKSAGYGATPDESGLNAAHPTSKVRMSSQATSAPGDPGMAGPPASRIHSDVLASSLTDVRLNRALYNLRARARTAAEEQGVNILFVAFGLLHWVDAETKEAAQSPILLVPVQLEKERGRAAYALELLEDDLLLNPTLVYKLATDFDLRLPDLPGDIEAAGFTAYFEQLRGLIARRSGWGLTDEAILGVFSFQKINLYQDLADHQDLYAAHPVVAALGGRATLPPPPQTIFASELDDRVQPSNSFQVIDADASQQEAIEAAKAGASFVLQGPPGTGKSQTITNIIAESLAAGKHVLFVSQKMAALEVVQHRLNQAGLGGFCLQLHSHKRDKREVVRELIDALDAPDVQLRPEYHTALLELEDTRRKLNAYVKALHAPRFALHHSVFDAYGEIARWRRAPDVRFDVGDVTRVDAAQLAQRLQLLDRFEALPDIVDRFQQHPWRGVALRSVSFAQRKQVEQTLAELIDLLPQYADRLKSLAAACQLRAPGNLQEAQALLDLLKENDPRLFTLDLDALEQRFEQEYRSLLRTVKSSYRAEIKELDDINRPDDQLDYEEAVALLKQAQAVKRLLSGEPAQADRIADVRSFVQGTLTVRERLNPTLGVLKEIYGGDWPVVDQRSFDQAGFVVLPNWLALRQSSLDQLEPYTALLRLSDEATAQGLGSFGKAALAMGLPANQWKDAYLLNFWQAFVDAAAQADDVLRSFDSHSREAMIARFRELDRQQLILNQARLRALMSDRRPNNTWISADSAEAAILRREGAKKRRLKPLRKLLAEISRLIADVKPCLMMSPLSVATLLDPHVFKFDVVIFDEASQIAPEEAAGAIMRGAQVVIAGDSKQLPPTRFFSVIGSDDEDAASEEEGRVFESILDESTGLNLPQKMLRWHYRSRDEELIAFSNHHFYGDRLFTFPNVQQDGKDSGVEFVHVPEGVYRRGRSQRRNEVEAQRVVDLIFAHAAQQPDQTLGVITFSYAQRDAIVAEWERRRRDQPQYEAFFDENAREPFFIKNLEMVQGDERDVIFFSVGYGKDESGKVLMNFGPLNQDGGERRLNVAVTRARYNVKLISSIQPEDIDLTRTQSQGAQRLRDYLFYARDGFKSLHSVPAELQGAHASTATAASLRPISAQDDSAASPFEDAVHQALTAGGLTLHRQVGASSYRLDLAVVDPQRAGRYLLGIECDGAMYASAPTARERDRLRQQVLEQLGWKMHRIWSHNWVSNQAAEVEKVMTRLKESAATPETTDTATTKPSATAQPLATQPPKTIEAAVGSPRAVADTSAAQPATAEAFLAPAETPEETKSLPTYVWPYLYAKLPSHTEPLSQATPHDLVDEVIKVVGTEGPIHIELVYARLGTAWNVSRLTPKVKQLMITAIGMAQRAGRIEQHGDFLWPIGLATPVVRAPKEGDKVRSIEHIAPEEIAEAAFLCVQEARSLSEADLIMQTAKLLGYARVTKKIDAAVTQAIGALKVGGRINETAGLVRVA